MPHDPPVDDTANDLDLFLGLEGYQLDPGRISIDHDEEVLITFRSGRGKVRDKIGNDSVTGASDILGVKISKPSLIRLLVPSASVTTSSPGADMTGHTRPIRDVL